MIQTAAGNHAAGKPISAVYPIFRQAGRTRGAPQAPVGTTGWRPPILGIRFDAGEITLSGTAEDIPLYDQKIALVRHQNGDWGGVTEQEWAENNRSLQNGRGVVHSLYSFLISSIRLGRYGNDGFAIGQFSS